MNTRRSPLAIWVVADQVGLAEQFVEALAGEHDRVAARVARMGGDLREAAVVVMALGDGPVNQPSLDWLLTTRQASVVVLATVDDEETAVAALRQGAAGYLLSDLPASEVVAALERVAAGQTAVDPVIAGRIISRLAQGTWRERSSLEGWGLRPRERQVLESLIEGRSNREIARQLDLGEETVKTYLRSGYRKLGARDRSQAIATILSRTAPPERP